MLTTPGSGAKTEQKDLIAISFLNQLANDDEEISMALRSRTILMGDSGYRFQDRSINGNRTHKHLGVWANYKPWAQDALPGVKDRDEWNVFENKCSMSEYYLYDGNGH